jgi:hypothetical protein
MEGQHPNIMDELIVFLKNKDHECMQIHGMANHEFKWCQQDVCPKTRSHIDMKRRQQEFEDDVAMLKRQGHTCVRTQDTYPGKITYWCERIVCTNNLKK